MNDYITVKIFRPDDYHDVADDLVLSDFLGCPSAFQIELVDERPQTGTQKAAEWTCAKCGQCNAGSQLTCGRCEDDQGQTPVQMIGDAATLLDQALEAVDDPDLRILLAGAQERAAAAWTTLRESVNPLGEES